MIDTDINYAPPSYTDTILDEYADQLVAVLNASYKLAGTYILPYTPAVDVVLLAIGELLNAPFPNAGTEETVDKSTVSNFQQPSKADELIVAHEEPKITVASEEQAPNA